MRTLSPRERKLVVLLTLVAALTLIWMIVIGPILAGFAERSSARTSLAREYQSNQRLIGSVPRLRRQVERQRETLQGVILFAPNRAAASLALEERIQKAVERAGGELRGVEDASDAGSLVRSRVSARLTLAQMAAVVGLLENERPFLVLEALDVAADQAAISGRLEILEVGFEVAIPVTTPAPR